MGLWRDGKKLVCSANAQFPPRCVKSNQQTNNRVQKTFSYCPPWAYIVFGALVAMFFTRKMQVDYAVEPRWTKRRIVHALSGVGVALFGLVLMGITGAVLGSSDGGIVGLIGVAFMILSMVLMFGGFIYALVGGRVLSVVYIDDTKEHAWLKGAHPNFLETLPTWSGPSH